MVPEKQRVASEANVDDVTSSVCSYSNMLCVCMCVIDNELDEYVRICRSIDS